MGRVIVSAVCLTAALVALALAQVPPSNLHERELQEVNRSFEQRQRDVQQQQQREFETNQRVGAPQTQRLPGARDRQPGCPAGSAGC
jgi:GTPase SAR1 family protein